VRGRTQGDYVVWGTEVGVQLAKTHLIAWRPTVKQRTAFGSLLLALAFSTAAAAQPGLELEDEEGLEEEAPAEAPAEPAPAPAEPAPDTAAPAEEGAPAEEPAAVEGEAAVEGAVEGEAEVGVGAEIGADTAAPVAEPAADTGDSGEILVTGTRIKRSQSFAPSAPVEVIDRKQLEYSGATNLADVVQYLTVAQGQGSQGGSAAGPATAVDLRGLGAGATLVLINGRRTNPTGAGLVGAHYQDVGVVPLAAVERIEILKAGASAIYGADAVGGVINVITRKNFDGLRLQLDGQTTQEFDHGEWTGSAAFGAMGERSRVLVGTSYNRRSALHAGEREFTEGYLISTQGFPGSYLVGTMVMPDPNCEMVEGSRLVPGATGAPVCGFDYRDYTDFFGNQERINAMGTGEYDLTDHLMLFGEIIVSRFRGDTVTSPTYPIPPAFPVVPADHIDNPFGVPVAFIGRPRGREAGFPRNTTSDDVFRGVVGFKGDFEDAGADTVFESWEWELYTMMGISRYRLSTLDSLREPFVEAINSCNDPTDLTGCFNPFYSSQLGTGTPNSQAVIDSFSGEQVVMADHALQTYNAGMSGGLFELPGGDLGIAFGGEIRHEWRTSLLDHDSNELRYAFLLGNDDASAERDVYSGYLELRWPFYDGIELQTAARIERYTDTDSTPISPFVGLTLIPAEIGGRENAPGAFRRLQLRGTASQAFRAPTIFNTFPGCSTLPVPLRIPPTATLPVYTPVRICGNPDLDPETALALSGGISWTPVDWLSLTGDYWNYNYKDRIQAESSTQIIALDDANRMMGGPGDPRVPRDPVTDAVAEVRTKTVNIDGEWLTDGVDFGVMFNFDGGKFGGSEDDFGRIGLGAQGTYTLSFDVPRHQSAPRSIPANAAMMTPARTLPPADCEGNPTVNLMDMDPSNNGSPTDSCSVLGKRNSGNSANAIPVWRVNFPLIWTISDHSASVIGHYISGVEDDVEPNPDGSFDEIDAWFTLDLQYGYTLREVIGEELSLRVGCYNVFNKFPPPVNGLAASFEAELHDPRGRMFYARLASQF
jgi:outer membrane receptor for ferrienterochelin and colicin